jgi:hypothetical protein
MTAYPFSFLPQEFKGKRVLITGGTKGVGAHHTHGRLVRRTWELMQ